MLSMLSKTTRCALILAIAGAIGLMAVAGPAAAADDYPYASSSYCTGGSGCVDPWGFYYRQCTSFVAWRMNRDGVAFSNFMKGPNGTAGQFGNAGDWADNARAIGFAVDTTATVGSIAQWDSSDPDGTTSGHVAYVMVVNVDGSQVVEEYNAMVRGGYDQRTVRAPRFIHVHDGAAVTAQSTAGQLFFAEGTTRPGFTEYITLLNPTGADMTVDVEYLFADGTAPVTLPHGVPAATATWFDVAADTGPGRDVSVVVSGPAALSAARTMYVEAGVPATGPVTGVTQLAAITATASSWSFAEGSTLAGFGEYLTIQNPAPAPVTATISYALDGGAGPTVTAAVPASSRVTVDVNDEHQAGPGHTGVGATVTSAGGAPLLVERPMYFRRDVGSDGMVVDGASVAAGTSPAADWYFAEGTLLPGWSEYLTLVNQGDATATVTIRYLLEEAPPLTRTTAIGPHSRRTVAVFDGTDPAGAGRDATEAGSKGVAIHLVADRPILAERPLYTTAAIAPGITANDGHVAPGATGTTTCARFADVEAAGGNVSYLTLANPAGAAVEVTPTVWLDGTRSVQPPVPVAAGSRLTLDLARFLPAGRHGSSTTYGLELRSSSPFMVEEPQYLEMAGAAANGASLVEPSPCPPSPD